MQFSKKQIRIICIAVAAAMVLSIAIGVVGMFM